MNKTALKFTVAGAAAVGWMALSAFSPAAKKIEIAIEAGSTAAWEIAAMQETHFDTEHGIAIEVQEVADAAAAQEVLLGRHTNAIVTDFVWTSIQRHDGADVTFVPYALGMGGLMAMPDSAVQSVEALDGAALAVAGGPLDPAWLALQAVHAARTGAALPEAQFAAPAQVNDLLIAGEVGAALTAWPFNAAAAGAGAVEVMPVADMVRELGVEQAPPLLGWVFSERWAHSHDAEIERFLAASFETRKALLEDDALWDAIRPVMGADLSDEAFIALRDGYRAGIVTAFGQAEIAAAASLYAAIAPQGGEALAGHNAVIADGTFWDGFQVGE